MKSVLIKNLISFCPIYLTIFYFNIHTHTIIVHIKTFSFRSRITNRSIITKIIPPLYNAKITQLLQKSTKTFFNPPQIHPIIRIIPSFLRQ